MATINAVNNTLSGQSGTGAFVGTNSPTLVAPALGTPVSVTLTNASALPVGGISASGTPSSSTFLRGDGSWQIPSGATTIGSFTPTLAFGGASTGITYASNVGQYTMQSGLVAFTVYFQLTNKGSATGQATIEGLPFTSRNSLPFYVLPLQLGNVLTITGGITGLVIGNSTSIVMNVQSATTGTPLTDANFANGSEIFCAGTYLI